jgi:hypothetical protein
MDGWMDGWMDGLVESKSCTMNSLQLSKLVCSILGQTIKIAYS